MDEPCSALDPISTRVVEETIGELASDVTIVIVTHNMQQAQRVSDQCAFFLVEDQGEPGRIVEAGPTDRDVLTPRRPAHARLRARAVRMMRLRLSDPARRGNRRRVVAAPARRTRHRSPAAGPSVNGGGSSFAKLEIDQWRAEVARKPVQPEHQLRRRRARRSGASSTSPGSLDFAASDIPFTGAEAGSCCATGHGQTSSTCR